VASKYGATAEIAAWATMIAGAIGGEESSDVR
jgi:hypothetical protein